MIALFLLVGSKLATTIKVEWIWFIHGRNYFVVFYGSWINKCYVHWVFGRPLSMVFLMNHWVWLYTYTCVFLFSVFQNHLINLGINFSLEKLMCFCRTMALTLMTTIILSSCSSADVAVNSAGTWRDQAVSSIYSCWVICKFFLLFIIKNVLFQLFFGHCQFICFVHYFDLYGLFHVSTPQAHNDN